MILVVGEAVVDFLAQSTGAKPAGSINHSFRPTLGGSPFNVALGLGRLGTPVAYSWAISTDLFGKGFLDALAEADVNLDRVVRSPLPSTLSFIDTIDGEPRYAFFDTASAGRYFDPADITDLSDEISLLHVGSYVLGTEPVGSLVEEMVIEEAEHRLISLDLNVRPSLVEDEPAYRERLTRMMEVADIIKASAEDLAWLYPDVTHDYMVEAWLEAGAALAIVTLGAKGARIASAGYDVTKPAPPTFLIDTIGSGDAFMAGFLAGLDDHGAFSEDGLSGLGVENLEESFALARRCAALVCGRAGADMPWRHELMD
ncbi:MAG: carbohydrate kinase [Hyphomicrobiales bacterium]|nr:MAG: carbohydrate kinase [Hyphomicrobiales bacterium]